MRATLYRFLCFEGWIHSKRMWKHVLLGVAIVIIVCLIYYFFFSDTSKRNTAISNINKSNGTMDMYAEQALNELNRLTTLRPADRYRRANIIRYNIGDGDLTRLNNDALIIAANDYATVLRDLADGREPDINYAVMVNDIGNFLLDLAVLEVNVDRAVVEAWNLATPAQTEKRINDALQNSTTKAEALETYFKPVYTDQPQNVHDKGVVDDLSTSLRTMEETFDGTTPEMSIQQCRDYIAKHTTRIGEDKAKHALRVLSEIEAHSLAGHTVSTYNKSEQDIFGIVWRRSFDKDNSAKKELMQDAVIDALADSHQNGSVVCANGRTARLLASPVLLDHNPKVGTANSFEDYRNQIFAETDKIIKDEVASSLKSDDPEIKKIAESYTNPEVAINEESLVKFNQEIKNKIDDNLKNYNDKLRELDMKTIKEECYAFAAL